MTTHKETRNLPYPADLMYAIVADVEKYPQFLPWVTGLRIVRRIGDTAFDAEMCVGFAGLSERYVSRVTFNPAEHTIDVVKTQDDFGGRGPFRRLENHWRFTPKSEGTCEVKFAIAFEFKNPILNAVAGRAFQTVMLQMASAFEARARVLTKQT
jgi:coenzyme Q-binding protein COQ10